MRGAWAWMLVGLVACGESGTVGEGTDDTASESPNTPSGDDTPGDDTETPPTYHADIAPLLAERCGTCHAPEGLAPFKLDTYADAYMWRTAMLASVEEGSMPPFDARESDECTPPKPWKADLRMSDAEIDLLKAWVEADAPEGDPSTAADLPESLIETLSDPDEVLSIQEPFSVSGTRDVYQCFRIPLTNETERWIQSVEVRPGNDKIVHHVLVWTDADDQSKDRVGKDGSYRCSGTPDVFPTELLSAWAPGAGVMRVPEGTGTPVKPGASLVVNIHYHPTGAGTETDQTEIAIEWTEDKPARHITWYLVDIPFLAEVEAGPNDRRGPEFRIPADEPAHTETVALTIPDLVPFEIPIYAVAPHMHYLGTELKVTIDKAFGGEECLVHTPKYRFDWQTAYVYDAPVLQLPRVGPGDTIRVHCTYDNSWSNPYMGDALIAAGEDEPVDVYWGEETNQEMCMAMVGLVIPPIDVGDFLGGIF